MRTPIIALAAIALVGSPVLAASDDLVVNYADLDLSTPKGQKTLDRRIDAAARAYCDTAPTTGTRLKTGMKCVTEARAAAREQMAVLIEKSARKGG